MNNYYEPRHHLYRVNIRELLLTFDGEQYPGLDILDTKVMVNGSFLCCITWKDRFSFASELETIVTKYAI